MDQLSGRCYSAQAPASKKGRARHLFAGKRDTQKIWGCSSHLPPCPSKSGLCCVVLLRLSLTALKTRKGRGAKMGTRYRGFLRGGVCFCHLRPLDGEQKQRGTSYFSHPPTTVQRHGNLHSPLPSRLAENEIGKAHDAEIRHCLRSEKRDARRCRIATHLSTVMPVGVTIRAGARNKGTTRARSDMSRERARRCDWPGEPHPARPYGMGFGHSPPRASIRTSSSSPFHGDPLVQVLSTRLQKRPPPPKS